MEELQNKLMKMNSYDDGDSHWRIACDCGSPDHDVSLWFDANADDKSFGVINLNLNMEVGIYEHIVYSYKWYGPILEFFNALSWRIKVAAKILFTGNHIMSGNVILDLDGIKAMQIALDEGIKYAKKH